MRKKVGVVAGVVLALSLLPGVAMATTAVTFHINGVPIDVGPAGCIPGDLVIQGIGGEHQTVDNAGDLWLTGTLQGRATGTDATAGFTGHASAWFGVEVNNRNFTSSFTAEAVGTLADGTPLSIHQEGTFTINAQGVPVVTSVNATCN